jgi:ankyrin repeat protein
LQAREGDLESSKLLVSGGADVNALDGDGKDVLGLAIFNWQLRRASFLIDSHSKGESGRCQRFYHIVLGSDRAICETAPKLSMGG